MGFVALVALEGAGSVAWVVLACGLVLTLVGLERRRRGLREPPTRAPRVATAQTLGALDLATHRGIAVIGRTLTLQGATYRVETLPAAASGPTTFLLVNERTAIGLHRVRFFPDDEAGAPEAGAWSVAVPGGRAVLTLHQSPFEADAPWTDLISQAARARGDGDLARGEALIRRVIAMHPTHVLALNHLAGTLVMQARDAEALPIAMEVVEFEPNHPGFAINLVRLLAGTSPDAALKLYRSSCSWFPPDEASDELGVRLMLQLGEVHDALAILEARPSPSLTALQQAALAMRAAHERAAPLIEEACRRLEGKVTDGVLDLFQRALQANPQNPYTLVNVGLALARAGRHAEAAHALLQAMSRVSTPLRRLCIVNAAFALADDGNAKDAAALLDHGFDNFNEPTNSPGVLLADLPSRAIYVFPPDGSAEALPGDALERLERIADALQSTTPASVRTLMECYRRAALVTEAN
ncbi:MAG: hypothetical protein EPO40_12875 [Myxococcaceae bacterium]|nr:MAG: hypothetical protein EPO40_12875 [Myxococcaceae bacterium]